MSDNPYAAPNATLGSNPVIANDDLTDAVQGFVTTRRLIFNLGVLSFIIAVLSLGALAVVATQSQATQRGLMGIGQLVVIYFVVGVVLLRTSRPLYALAQNPTWTNVESTFNRITQMWTISLIGVAFGVLSNIALRFFAAPAAAFAAANTAGNAITDAAGRLSKMLRLCVGASIAASAFNIASTALAPTPEQKALGTSLWLMLAVGAAFQVLFLWLVWRQVPLLDRFIAAPSAATLEPVARAHRTLWRTSFWAIIVVFVIGVVAAIVVSVVTAFRMRMNMGR